MILPREGGKGSSPRMRGSLVDKADVSLLGGIIPAHAGLTARRPSSTCRRRDHPRACGAHDDWAHEVYKEMGSSPRMRGSHDTYHIISCLHGIIPAHAGLTSYLAAHSMPCWDHPRACGAHDLANYGRLLCEGSSPRMRGSRRCHYYHRRAVGIIPAHAGLTPSYWKEVSAMWDHPRACGAHFRTREPAQFVQGSSPRMRGSHPD